MGSLHLDSLREGGEAQEPNADPPPGGGPGAVSRRGSELLTLGSSWRAVLARRRKRPGVPAHASCDRPARCRLAHGAPRAQSRDPGRSPLSGPTTASRTRRGRSSDRGPRSPLAWHEPRDGVGVVDLSVGPTSSPPSASRSWPSPAEQRLPTCCRLAGHGARPLAKSLM